MLKFLCNPVIKGKIGLLSLFVVLFIDGLGISVTLPLVNDLFISKDTSILPLESSQIVRGIFYGASLWSFSLAMLLSSPILGDISDKFGRRRAITWCLWGTAVGYIFSGVGVYVKSPVLFILGRVCDGMTAGTIPIAQAMLNDITPANKRAGNIGVVLFFVTIGYVVGPIFSYHVSYIFSWSSLSIPFYAVSLLSLLNIFLISHVEFKESYVDTKVNWRKAFLLADLLITTKKIKVLLVSHLFFQLGWSIFFQLSPYFMSFHITKSETANVLSIMGIGLSISFLFLTRWCEKYISLKRGAIVFLSLLTILTVIQITIPSLSTIIITSFLGACFYAVTYAFLLGLLSKEAPPGKQGAIMGFAAGIAAFSSTVSAMVGSVSSALSHYLPYLLAIALYVFATLWLFLFSSGGIVDDD